MPPGGYGLLTCRGVNLFRDRFNDFTMKTTEIIVIDTVVYIVLIISLKRLYRLLELFLILLET